MELYQEDVNPGDGNDQTPNPGDGDTGTPTLVGGGDGAEPTPKGPMDWPEDWRTRLAGDDESEAERLSRFQSPKDVWESYRNLEKRFSDVSKRSLPPEDASEEVLAQWRKENGLPENPEGYLEQMGDLEIGDEDKPILEEFFKAAHKGLVHPDAAKEIVSWYYHQREEEVAARAEADVQAMKVAEDELHGEWGNDFRGNINAINGLLDLAPEGVKDKLLSARMADGTPVMSDPGTLRFLMTIVNQVNPAGTIVPSGGMNQLSTVEDRISEIETMMRENRKAYNNDLKVQEEYRKLITARETLKQRGG